MTKQQLAELIAKGLIPPQPKGGKRRRDGPEFVAASVVVRDGVLTAVLPVRTASEANCRAWRVKSNRTKDARQVMSAGLGRHLRALAPFAEAYHRGETLRVTITRLGGPRLDSMANLGPSLKATEDFLALLLGADDGDPRWRCEAAQEPGGPVGVRIELRTAGGGV